MKDIEQHKKVAVLIDADNAQYDRLKLILDELSVHGHIVTKRAYGDWSEERLKSWKAVLNELAIQPIQQFSYTSKKNSTDAAMIIDAMDMLYSDRYDAFALVSSDSDFTKLASRLRESEIFVFGFGEKKTPTSFRNACDDFVFVENLEKEIEEIKTAIDKELPQDEKKLIAEIMKGWETYQEEGWANVAPVGSLLKRNNSEFDARTYGAKSVPSLIAKYPDLFEMKKYPGKGGVKIVAFRPKQSSRGSD